jgi:hypothetical protein
MTSRKNKQHSQNVEIAIFIVVVIILLQVLLPIVSYSKWFQWWRDNNTDNKYNCLPLSLMAFYNSNTLMYNIVKLFTLQQNQFNHDWYIYFISGIMESQAVGIVPGGLCTPRSLCESLQPDTLYITTQDATQYNSQLQGSQNLNLQIQIPHNLLGAEKGSNKFKLTVSKYPKLYDVEAQGVSWRKVLIGWGAEDPQDTTTYKYNAELWFSFNDENPPISRGAKGWNGKNFPCWMNFLARWGIPGDAPVIKAYLSKKSADDQGPLYQTLLNPLLGVKSSNLSGGGWLGYLREGGDFNGRGLAEANRLLYSQDHVKPKFLPSDKSQQCNPADLASGTINMGLAGAFGGAALAGAETGTAVGGPLGALFGAVIGGVSGFFLTKASRKCTI